MAFFLLSYLFEPLFSVAYSFPQLKMNVKCPLITNLVPGKVEKENHIRKFRKREERKLQNIGKTYIVYLPKNIRTKMRTFKSEYHTADQGFY